MGPDEILDQIDSALQDWEVSDDAMRWTPTPIEDAAGDPTLPQAPVSLRPWIEIIDDWSLAYTETAAAIRNVRPAGGLTELLDRLAAQTSVAPGPTAPESFQAHERQPCDLMPALSDAAVEAITPRVVIGFDPASTGAAAIAFTAAHTDLHLDGWQRTWLLQLYDDLAPLRPGVRRGSDRFTLDRWVSARPTPNGDHQ